MSDELMDCPFCGGKAKVRNASLGAYVFCTKCLCSTAGETNPAKAIAAWNKRAELFGNLECYECMNGYPMVRLRTCTNVSEWHEVDEFVCSECGIKLADWAEVIEDEEQNFRFEYAFKYCPNCGARVLNEEEQGHQVADAIRRLEKAVER